MDKYGWRYTDRMIPLYSGHMDEQVDTVDGKVQFFEWLVTESRRINKSKNRRASIVKLGNGIFELHVNAVLPPECITGDMDGWEYTVALRDGKPTAKRL